MTRVVVVHGQEELGTRCRDLLESAGYETIACRGPQAPEGVCHVLEDGSCPLCESGDLMVYDPWVQNSLGPNGVALIIATLRRRYNEKPVVVLGAPVEVPLGIAQLAEGDPGLRFVAPGIASDLCQMIQALAAARAAVGRQEPSRWTASLHEQDPGLYSAADDCGYCD